MFHIASEDGKMSRKSSETTELGGHVCVQRKGCVYYSTQVFVKICEIDVLQRYLVRLIVSPK